MRHMLMETVAYLVYLAASDHTSRFLIDTLPTKLGCRKTNTQ